MTVPAMVGVYGGGRMGAGIAHAFLVSGAAVAVIEASPETATAARDRIERSLRATAERHALPVTLEDVLGRLVVSDELPALAGVELVIEAVPEDIATKRAVIAAIESVVPAAWLATNTSSLSVDAIADRMSCPERLVGMHFFNPVPSSSLIEVVVGARTSPELVALAQRWSEGLAKTAITVADSPGFASSRLGVALALEAMRMLEEGVATAEDIDAAMTLGYRHPAGPLRTTDVVGLDVRLAIAEHLGKQLGDRFKPPEILRSMVADGNLGRKTGQGFYTWPTPREA